MTTGAGRSPYKAIKRRVPVKKCECFGHTTTGSGAGPSFPTDDRQNQCEAYTGENHPGHEAEAHDGDHIKIPEQKPGWSIQCSRYGHTLHGGLSEHSVDESGSHQKSGGRSDAGDGTDNAAADDPDPQPDQQEGKANNLAEGT